MIERAVLPRRHVYLLLDLLLTSTNPRTPHAGACYPRGGSLFCSCWFSVLVLSSCFLLYELVAITTTDIIACFYGLHPPIPPSSHSLAHPGGKTRHFFFPLVFLFFSWHHLVAISCSSQPFVSPDRRSRQRWSTAHQLYASFYFSGLWYEKKNIYNIYSIYILTVM